MSERLYRGWRIEGPVTDTQIGHKLPGSRRISQQHGFHTHRQIRGYLLHNPEGGEKWVDTLAEARRYIDEYMGPASRLRTRSR